MHQNVFLLSDASRAGRLRNWDLSCGSPLMPDRKGATCKGHAVQSMWTCKHTLQSAAHAVFVMWTWGRDLKGRGVCIEAGEVRAGGSTQTAGVMLMRHS